MGLLLHPRGFLSVQGDQQVGPLTPRQESKLGGQFFIIGVGSIVELALILKSYSGRRDLTQASSPIRHLTLCKCGLGG